MMTGKTSKVSRKGKFSTDDRKSLRTVELHGELTIQPKEPPATCTTCSRCPGSVSCHPFKSGLCIIQLSEFFQLLIVILDHNPISNPNETQYYSLLICHWISIWSE